MDSDLIKIKEFLLDNEYIISVIGPTATGKSGLAVELALLLEGEIISLDSMQVYRGMDIGTGKITGKEMKDVPHHLLDVATLDMKFSAGRFSQLAEEKIEEVRSRRRIPLIVGGTGLYLRALLKGLLPTPARSGILRKRIEKWESDESLKSLHGFLRRIDPAEAGFIDPNDRQRIYRAIEIYLVTGRTPTGHKEKHGFGEDKYNVIKIGLNFEDRETLYATIESRVDAMFEDGWIGEVEALLKEYPSSANAYQAIGYREIVDYLDGKCSLDELKIEVKKTTRRYAKRQLTWFRKDEDITWFDAGADKKLVCEKILQYIERQYDL